MMIRDDISTVNDLRDDDDDIYVFVLYLFYYLLNVEALYLLYSVVGNLYLLMCGLVLLAIIIILQCGYSSVFEMIRYIDCSVTCVWRLTLFHLWYWYLYIY
jgi:hypothetical protein